MTFSAIAESLRWLGVDVLGGLCERARDRVFQRSAEVMKSGSADRADLRAIGTAVLKGVMGALVEDPEVGVALAAEALAPAAPLEDRKLAAAREATVANIVQSYHDAKLRSALEARAAPDPVAAGVARVPVSAGRGGDGCQGKAEACGAQGLHAQADR